MKCLLIRCLIFFASLVTIHQGTTLPSACAEELLIDSVIATVDDKPITLVELGRRLAPPQRISLAQLKSEDAIQKALDNLILEKLLLVEAERKNIKISDEDIDRYIAEVRDKNNLSEEGFAEALRNEGQTLATYRERVKTEILKSRVASASIKNSTTITDEEVKAFLRQKLDGESVNARGPKAHLRRIALNGKSHSAEEARRISETIKARLKDGEDFEDLAKQFSEGPEKDKGGDLGILPINDLSADVIDAITSLKSGETSYLITSPLGFQIFQVVERVDPAEENKEEDEAISKKIEEVSDEVKQQVKQKLEAEKLERKMVSFIDVELPKLHTVEKKF